MSRARVRAELGHHILRHAEQYDRGAPTAHQRELEADGVTGRVLALAGVAPDDFERVLAYFGMQETETHPHGLLRTTQVHIAYQQARIALVARIVEQCSNCHPG